MLYMDCFGVPIAGSPFKVKIFDAKRVFMSDINGNEVGKESEFTLDASSAGEGQMEISINDGTIKNNVKQIRPGVYSVTFVPVEAELYTIECKFNGELVFGNFYLK